MCTLFGKILTPDELSGCVGDDTDYYTLCLASEDDDDDEDVV
jgi:hypothetical protein